MQFRVSDVATAPGTMTHSWLSPRCSSSGGVIGAWPLPEIVASNGPRISPASLSPLTK
ncbi:hypothetical protein D3C83_278090 [compost metagenome]